MMAEHVDRCLGSLQDCRAVVGHVNSGIRGLPPGFALEQRMEAVLACRERDTGDRVVLTSELDEQGMQAVALAEVGEMLRVRIDEVSICSPFWPRQPGLGSCGAHFVGLNSKEIPWNYYDRPGLEVRQEHWDRHRPELYRRAGLEMGPALAVDVE